MQSYYRSSMMRVQLTFAKLSVCAILPCVNGIDSVTSRQCKAMQRLISRLVSGHNNWADANLN